MARMDYLRSSNQFQRQRRFGGWLLGGAAIATGAFLVGILISNPVWSRRAQWGWEQARAWTRDTFVRQSDTLPAPAELAAEPVEVAAPSEVVPDDLLALQAERDVLPVSEPVDAPAGEPEQTFDILEAPPAFELSGFQHEFQDINNCGPTTLAMDLRYWGWEGDQYTIADVVKPVQRDKNVRWDELVYYVRTQAGWLDALFRVGGDFGSIETFVANGYPVIIETGYTVDDYWVGHYLLVTGYDRAERTFIVQDVTGGPNRRMAYETVDELWQQFNRLYILVFPAGDRDKIEFMLGDNADLDADREMALAQAEADVTADPENAFAWFNLGSNLNYFDRYAEAAEAYDRAREIGLPWRMLFYQFGPYIAYFNTGRYEDVESLATATLDARPDLEESYVWRGWARHMLGDTAAAIQDFNAALLVNPNYTDAITALEYFGAR